MSSLRQKGLSLIEVMITLAVFSFGVLALATLMASGLKYNTSALHRSYATSQAYDMADRMRANHLGLDYYLIDPSPRPNCVSFVSECESTKCTPEAMALYDARQWNNYNACLLPQGSGTVSLNSASGIYAITITWNDERDSDTPDDSFIVEFQP